ncbi:hypothetical protein J3F84DRAFT_358106 [Trichoderma pleuroticola]
MPTIVTAVPPLLSFPVAQCIPGNQLCMRSPSCRAVRAGADKMTGSELHLEFDSGRSHGANFSSTEIHPTLHLGRTIFHRHIELHHRGRVVASEATCMYCL